ncbi:MAG: lysophospholipid acyltransferase family protein [Planctomycetota bacterium]
MDQWTFQPASDLDESVTRRLGSVRREPGLFGWAVHALTASAAAGYMRLYHRLTVRGSEHLPDDPPAIIVANHTSHLDAAAITAALPRCLRREAFSLAADDYFFRTTFRSACAAIAINALPMRRGKAVRQALADLRRRMENGHCLLIVFPEGTRSRTGTLAEFKCGVGMLVAGLSVPIVPAWIDGAHRALPPGKRCPRPAKLEVRFGPTLDFAETPNKRDGWQHVADRCFDAVHQLSDAVN